MSMWTWIHSDIIFLSAAPGEWGKDMWAGPPASSEQIHLHRGQRLLREIQQCYGGVECWMSEFTVIEPPHRNLGTSCTPSTYLHASSQRNAGMPHESSPPAMVTWRARSLEYVAWNRNSDCTRCFDLKFQSDSPPANNITTAISKEKRALLSYWLCTINVTYNPA